MSKTCDFCTPGPGGVHKSGCPMTSPHRVYCYGCHIEIEPRYVKPTEGHYFCTECRLHKRFDNLEALIRETHGCLEADYSTSGCSTPICPHTVGEPPWIHSRLCRQYRPAPPTAHEAQESEPQRGQPGS